MDLFETMSKGNLERQSPLADKMRPENIEDFVGQKHIIGEGSLLRRCIKADRIQSMIFYGPPGTGKTTLARIIATHSSKKFEQLNAVTSGIKDIREVILKAENNLAFTNNNTILFIDEIHRFNKSQQDALLPFVENGLIVLIGATTENPMFEVNKALLSRTMVMEFVELSDRDMDLVFEKALLRLSKEMGNFELVVENTAKEHLINISAGDSRVMLNALELAVMTTDYTDGKIIITDKIMEQSVQKKIIRYEKNGNEHYDTISAFIKSMRGSDPDATLYWLAKMIHAGEDPKFIARRIVICASEDVGNADPNALNIAVSAFNAVNYIGMPEGRIILSQAATYIACAPKSNACYIGINKALEDIKTFKIGEVPFHLKDSKNKKYLDNEGIEDYKYPHNYERSYVKQQYLPDDFRDRIYYEPKNIGYEKIIAERLKYFKE